MGRIARLGHPVAVEAKRFDVLAVNIDTSVVRIMATDKDEDNAEAIIGMAVMRRGVDEEFYVETPSGSYKDGDKWTGRPDDE